MASYKLDAYIVILNWNGFRDTIPCLESVFALRDASFRVILCDNGSTDHSIERIKEWCEGKGKQGELCSKSPAPIRFIHYSRDEAELGGQHGTDEYELVIVENGENLGFAGGINVGLRYVVHRGDAAFIWILNNDTVLEPLALANLLRAARSLEKPGILTPTVLMADRPGTVWALGTARYFRWKGTAALTGYGKPYVPSGRTLVPYLPSKEYPVGAAMFVSAEFVRQVGLLSERYFLYFEELDWISRHQVGFQFAYIPDAIVFHRGSASILRGSNQEEAQARRLYWLTRSRFLYTRAFLRHFLPFVVISSMLHVVWLLLKGQFLAARSVAIPTLTLGSCPVHPPFRGSQS